MVAFVRSLSIRLDGCEVVLAPGDSIGRCPASRRDAIVGNRDRTHLMDGRSRSRASVRGMVGRLLALTVTVAAVFCVRDARALGPVDLEVGAKVGGGTNPLSGESPNPLGLGIGGRAGLAFAGIYGGVALMYYVGESQNVSSALGSGSISDHVLMYGFEGGYSLYFLDKLLTIRPQIGVGNFTISVSGSGSVSGIGFSGSNSANNLYLEPGVTALISIGQWFVGADANVLILPGITDPGGTSSSTDTAFTLHAQGGVKF